MTDKNVRSVIKYNGYSQIVRVENRLLKKGRLFAARLSNGYCLFQDAGEVTVVVEDGKTRDFHYIIYYERLLQELPKKLDFLLDEKYFYKKRCLKSELEDLAGKNGEYYKGFLDNDERRYFDLGIQRLPQSLEPQRYFRDFEWNRYSNKTRLYLHDVFCWELLEYKQETPEYLAFSPDTGGVAATLRAIEQGFVLEKWNLEWVQERAEEVYSKNPYIRPTFENYEELRAKLPTVDFRRLYEGDGGKLRVIDSIETALVAFADGLTETGKPTIGNAKKLTKELVLTLNAIDKETGFIETLEREAIYAYIAKLLAKLKKSDAIEVIDEYREW